MKLDGGKYEIKRSSGRVLALRHGEPWRDLTGDNLIFHLMANVDDMKKAIAIWSRENAGPKVNFGSDDEAVRWFIAYTDALERAGPDV